MPSKSGRAESKPVGYGSDQERTGAGGVQFSEKSGVGNARSTGL